jgi:hypothetical protein
MNLLYKWSFYDKQQGSKVYPLKVVISTTMQRGLVKRKYAFFDVCRETILLIVFLLTGVALISEKVYCQELAKTNIQLKNTTISISSNASDWLSAYLSNSGGRPQQVIVVFNSTLSEQQKQHLRDKGLSIIQYVQSRGYTAVIYPGISTDIFGIASIWGFVDVKPGWKVDQYLEEKAKIAKTVDLDVSFIDGFDIEDVRTLILQEGGKLLPSPLQQLGIYRMSIASSTIKQLATRYEICYLSAAPENLPLNFESKTATKVNLGSLPSAFGGYGLTGQGVTIGVGDNTSGITHVDLRDRVINYAPGGYTNHGVHINGIVGGAAIVEPKGEGMAPAATLVDHIFSAVWEQTTEMFESHNMTLTNNSYAAVIGSCKYAGTYDNNSLAVDKMALKHKNILHVFAAGNDGYLDCLPYPKGFATINGGYQPSKNIIVVTSTDKNYVNAVDGSRGPVKDGRLKPEMAAVGVNVTSTTRTDEYLTSGGTSMACPEVTGALALMTERYKQMHSNSYPNADVLKTLMLNGTVDIGNPGPDYRYGFGIMNLYRSLQMMDNNRYYVNNISNGGQQTNSIIVPPNTAQLKVMLCWHDAPGNPLSATQLINDLDLVVTEPSGSSHLPLVLDPAPEKMNNNATEGADHRNNCEQVVIKNPTPGNYTVSVDGYDLPAGIQDYVIAYDFVPAGISITYPTTRAQVKANDSLRTYWDASDNGNSLALEYTIDNGNNWIVINNNIPAERRFYTWFVPGNINSGECKMRLTRNNTSEAFTTGDFAMTVQPVANLTPVQCPGYIRFNWTPIPNATGYRIYRKVGPQMKEVATTLTHNEYTLAGLAFDSLYYIAVAPVVNGITGYRSKAIKRMPNDGNCEGDISDGDLMVERIASPVSGRKFTSGELSNSETVTVVIRNLDDAPSNHYEVSYSFNNGPWQSQVSNDPIAARSVRFVDLADFDFSAVGDYNLRIAIRNILKTDNVPQNDSLMQTIRHLRNDVISLSPGFQDDFENMPAVRRVADSFGVSPNDHWDYGNSTDSGQFRSFVNTGITLKGNRSVSFDTYISMPDNQNNLTGTFNLSGYDAAKDEVRLEFDYLLHGRPKFTEGNEVWIRGNDQEKWQSVFRYRTDNVGEVRNTGSVSVTDGLQAAVQSFSSSFQVRIGQHDSSLIAARNYGNGLTFDDFKLYTVQNDLQLLSVVAPNPTLCGAGGDVPLIIRLRNGVNQNLSNIKVNYRLDDGPVVTEMLAGIEGKKTVQYSFQNRLDLAKTGAHTLKIWVIAEGDNYSSNDSINNYKISNQPLVKHYPYKENFENREGGFYSEGQNNSWEYGMPAASKIKTAASGTKAWKTNLDGFYNNLELSYLYTPCFDVSGMVNPTLRFQSAIDIENCGMVLCDAAYVEYSTDSIDWTRLEDMNKGINWYNDTSYQIWSIEDFTTWHEVISPLPKGNHVLRLRFAMYSDQNGQFEGMAIDDLEVFDQRFAPVNTVVSVSPNPTADGRIKIVWGADAGTVMQLTMTDLMGRQVYSTSITAQQAYNESMIQTPRFYSGLYVMKLMIGEKVAEYKIVYL